MAPNAVDRRKRPSVGGLFAVDETICSHRAQITRSSASKYVSTMGPRQRAHGAPPTGVRASTTSNAGTSAVRWAELDTRVGKGAIVEEYGAGRALHASDDREGAGPRRGRPSDAFPALVNHPCRVAGVRATPASYLLLPAVAQWPVRSTVRPVKFSV